MGNLTFRFAENGLIGLSNEVSDLKNQYAYSRYSSRDWDDAVAASFEGVVSKLSKESEAALEANRALIQLSEQIDERPLERHAEELQELERQIRSIP